MIRRKFNTSYSFIDLLVNMLLGFFLLLLLTITVVNDPVKKNKKEGDIILKAEYLVTMEWPDGNPSDIDLMVKTPSKHVAFYGHKDIPDASLDRDDMGALNNSVKLDDGTVISISTHWEHVTIRKALAGEYVVNVLLYAKRSQTDIPVTIKVERLNPYQMVFSGTVVLKQNREERTAIAFTLDKNGNVIKRSNLQQPLSGYIIEQSRRRQRP